MYWNSFWLNLSSILIKNYIECRKKAAIGFFSSFVFMQMYHLVSVSVLSCYQDFQAKRKYSDTPPAFPWQQRKSENAQTMNQSFQTFPQIGARRTKHDCILFLNLPETRLQIQINAPIFTSKRNKVLFYFNCTMTS